MFAYLIIGLILVLFLESSDYLPQPFFRAFSALPLTHGKQFPLSNVRVRELAMSRVEQGNESELFLIDCFKEPKNTHVLNSHSYITCLLRARGLLYNILTSRRSSWFCQLQKLDDVTSSQRIIARKATEVAELFALGERDKVPYAIEIVECDDSVSGVDDSVSIVISVGDYFEKSFLELATSVPFVVPPALPRISSFNEKNVFLAGYTCIDDGFWGRDSITGIASDPPISSSAQFDGMIISVALWVKFHIALGMEHITIFLDIRTPEPFLHEFEIFLETEIESGQLTFVKARSWMTHDKFRYQECLQNAALWWYKGQASWLATFDIDEYFQPNFQVKEISSKNSMRTFIELSGNSVHLEGSMDAPTIAVPSQFWWGREMWTTNIPSLDKRPVGEYLPVPVRSKCIYSVSRVIASGVHAPILPASFVVTNEKDMRLNHFKFFGRKHTAVGWMLEVEDDSPFQIDTSFRRLWFELGLPNMSCATRLHPQCFHGRTLKTTQ